jgi:hypothetical protein
MDRAQTERHAGVFSIAKITPVIVEGEAFLAPAMALRLAHWPI